MKSLLIILVMFTGLLMNSNPVDASQIPSGIKLDVNALISPPNVVTEGHTFNFNIATLGGTRVDTLHFTSYKDVIIDAMGWDSIKVHFILPDSSNMTSITVREFERDTSGLWADSLGYYLANGSLKEGWTRNVGDTAALHSDSVASIVGRVISIDWFELQAAIGGLVAAKRIAGVANGALYKKFDFGFRFDATGNIAEVNTYDEVGIVIEYYWSD